MMGDVRMRMLAECLQSFALGRNQTLLTIEWGVKCVVFLNKLNYIKLN